MTKPLEAHSVDDSVTATDSIKAGWACVDQGRTGDRGWRDIVDSYWFQKKGLKLSEAEGVQKVDAMRFRPSSTSGSTLNNIEVA